MTSTAQLITMLKETANLFRLGQEASASKQLRICLDNLEESHQRVIQNPEFNNVLHCALNAQSHQDWLGLADYLEFDITQLLSQPEQATVLTESKSTEPDNQNNTFKEILPYLYLLADRYHRDYDLNQTNLTDYFTKMDTTEGAEEIQLKWDKMTHFIFSQPHWLSLLMPELNNELVKRSKLVNCQNWLPQSQRSNSNIEIWRNQLLDPSYRNTQLIQLIVNMATGNLAQGDLMKNMRQFYLLKDLMYAFFVDSTFLTLLNDIINACEQQLRQWNFSYVSGYPYQGLELIGVSGAKP